MGHFNGTKIAQNLLFWPIKMASLAKIARTPSMDICNKRATKTCYFSQVTPSDFNQNPYSREPTKSDILCREMGGLKRSPGTARRPQKSTDLPARL